MSRAKAYELAGSTGTVVTVPGCPAGAVYNYLTSLPCGTTTTTPVVTLPSVLGGEEAELSIEVDAEDDLSNDKAGQHAFTIEIEADDRGGDAKVERMDLEFSITPKSGTSEDDVYDIIEAISLEIDGDEVASVDTDSRSDWDSGDVGSDAIRISGLDFVVKSGDKVEIDVLLDIADLDAADLSLDIDLDFVEIRYSDGAGIVDTESTGSSALGEQVSVDAMDAIEFDADETSDNPNSVTVSLNEDRDDIVVLVNDIEVDGQDGTIEEATVTFSYTIAGLDTQAELEDLIDEVYLNGDKADDINWVDGTPDTIEAVFDMDEMKVEVGDEFEVEITVDFKETVAYTGTLKVKSVTFDGEGYDGKDFNNKVVTPDSAPTVTLTSGALILASHEVDGYNEFGTLLQAAKVTFEVELENEGDKDIVLGDGALSYQAFTFEIGGLEYVAKADGTLVDSSTATTPLAGYSLTIKNERDALVAGDNDEIADGSSETYVITVTVDANVAVAGTGEYGIELTTVDYTIDPLGTPAAGTLTVNLEAEEIDLLKNNG
jgi:hypothetical protein